MAYSDGGQSDLQELHYGEHTMRAAAGAGLPLLSNGLRVLLTGQCNYRCIFCHNEGLSREEKGLSDIAPELVVDFVQAGVRDLTFSGGEPLLRWDVLTCILQKLQAGLPESLCRELGITIVTNGTQLDNEKIACLCEASRQFRVLKLNVSVHSVAPSIYDTVTQTEGKLAEVRNRIRAALAAGLDVRLNFVLLRERNTVPVHLDAILAESAALGVKAIKLIEFLVTKLNRDFYREFSRLEPFIFNSRHRAVRTERVDARTTRHTFADPALTVHYVRCTCALGCRHCPSTRELELVPGNRFIACMAEPPLAIEPGEGPPEIAARAFGRLAAMEARYGERSPSVTMAPTAVHGQAAFPVQETAGAKSALETAVARRYSLFRQTRYVRSSRPADPQFTHLEPTDSTHSRILCAHVRTVTCDEMTWQSTRYFDPVYDFSRTRREVNARKLEMMGVIAVESQDLETDEAILPVPSALPAEAVLKMQHDLQTREETWSLVFRFTTEGPWDKEEVLKAARDLAQQWGLVLVPHRDAAALARAALKRLCAEHHILLDAARGYYESNDPGHQLDHILRVAENALHLRMAESVSSVPEKTLFLAALLHDMVRSPATGHAAASADEAIQLLHRHGLASKTCRAVAATIRTHSHCCVAQPGLSEAQKLLQDADFLDCFGLPMIIRSCLYHQASLVEEAVAEHLLAKCLRATAEDFHYESARRLALPGWHIIRQQVFDVLGEVENMPTTPGFAPGVSGSHRSQAHQGG